MEDSPEPQAAPSILIVDDSAEARQLLSQLLQAEGYRLLVARDGQEALRIVERVPELALVVLDIVMPGNDGLEVCRRIRKRDDERYLPVVLATVLSDHEHVVDGLAAGADDYVTKPFVKTEVLARVRAALRLKRATDELLDARALAAVGAMATTLGHEINNPLTTVLGNLELVLRSGRSDEKNQRRLSMAFEAAGGIRELVQRLVEIRKVVITTYINTLRMLDIEASCAASQRERVACPGAKEREPEDEEGDSGPQAQVHHTARGCHAGRPRAEADAIAPEAATDPPDSTVFDKAVALARAGGDEALLCATVELFLADCERLLAEIDRAVGGGDLAGLERAAREIKGAAGDLSAAAAATAAGEIEHLARHGDLEQAPAAADGLRVELARLRPVLAPLVERTSP